MLEVKQNRPVLTFTDLKVGDIFKWRNNDNAILLKVSHDHSFIYARNGVVDALTGDHSSPSLHFTRYPNNTPVKYLGLLGLVDTDHQLKTRSTNDADCTTE